MEAFYLLATILSNFLKSLTLSLLLLFRTLLPRHWFSRSSFNSLESVSLYEGTVWHERRRPVRHSFRYPVRYALYNLDHAPHAPPDHLSADQARQIASTNGQVYVYARHSHPHVKLFLFMFLSVTLFWGLSLRFIQLCHMLMCKGVNFFFFLGQFAFDNTSECGIRTKPTECVLLLRCWSWSPRLCLYSAFEEVHCWGVWFFTIDLDF